MAYAGTICYALCGTERAYAATICYALCSTERAYAATTCYALCGTERAYAATTYYALCSTERAYAATTCYVMCGTKRAYAATRCVRMRVVRSTPSSTGKLASCTVTFLGTVPRAQYALSGTEQPVFFVPGRGDHRKQCYGVAGSGTKQS
eukprot:1336703-Rhodomonas_salina.1